MRAQGTACVPPRHLYSRGGFVQHGHRGAAPQLDRLELILETATATALVNDAGAQVDAARFPRLASYLAALPQGFDSYPECQIKGFYFRESLQTLKGSGPLGAGWPEPLQKAVAAPPSNSAFMPEVLYCAFRLCVADQLQMAQPAYEEWVLGNSRSIYKGFVGKLIMAFASKRMLLDAAGSRWAMIHRGSTFHAAFIPDSGIYRGTLQFPANLFNEMLLRGLGGVMRAAFELVEKKSFVLDLVEFTDTTARYETKTDAPDGS